MIEIKHRITGAVLHTVNACTLYDAYLLDADLCGANLSGANLRDADLCGADLSGACIKDIKEATLTFARTSIVPQEGSFVGRKRLSDGIIARVVIPHDAKRLNAFGSRKCRASAVVVHEMWLNGKVFTGTAYDLHTLSTAYVTGQTVLPDSFSEDRCVECSHGIHFFLTMEEAEAYS